MLTSVTPRVRRWFFDDCFIKNLLLTLLSKNFKNWSTFDEVMDKKVDRLKRPVRCGTVQLEDKLISSQIYGGSNCCNIIILRQSASVTVLCLQSTSIKLIYQQCFHSPAEANSDWLNGDRARWRFVTTAFFFVAAEAFIRSLSVSFGVSTVNVLHQNDANITGRIFY